MVNTAAGILRAKASAVLLGPAGVGLMGLYGSVLDLSVSLAGLGVNSSGVRQIAEAAGSGETSRIARTAAVLRRTSLLLGVLAALALVACSGLVSRWTFGNSAFAVPVACLSVAVLMRLINDGQGAALQGMRRISDLARISILSTAAGTAITILLLYALGERGIVPSLVAAVAATLVISSWYVRKLGIPAVPLSVTEMRAEAAPLLKLGTALMVSGLMSAGGAYVIRIMVRDGLGLEAAGLYQAAWTLGGLYVGAILQAMGTDFYPRLTAVVRNHAECNRLVNEQAHVSLLLAGPGVIATITFAPLVVAVFYDTTFVGAVEPLRWICLGMALRVIAWPMGYIIVASGARRLLVFTEIAAVVVHLGLAWSLIPVFGLRGAAMAFVGLYVWHAGLVYAIVRRLTGFRWATPNRRDALLFVVVIFVLFGAALRLSSAATMGIGLVAAAASGVYSWRSIRGLLSTDAVPKAIRRPRA